MSVSDTTEIYGDAKVYWVESIGGNSRIYGNAVIADELLGLIEIYDEDISEPWEMI